MSRLEPPLSMRHLADLCGDLARLEEGEPAQSELRCLVEADLVAFYKQPIEELRALAMTGGRSLADPFEGAPWLPRAGEIVEARGWDRNNVASWELADFLRWRIEGQIELIGDPGKQPIDFDAGSIRKPKDPE